jgi:tetratricopeptide (TPR) repeat protein
MDDRKLPPQITDYQDHYPDAVDASESNTTLLKDVGNRALLVGAVPRAIEYYQQALQAFVLEDLNIEWAEIQNNLGYAYSLLPTGERQANLERAIACYQAAIIIFKLARADYYLQGVNRNLQRAKQELEGMD